MRNASSATSLMFCRASVARSLAVARYLAVLVDASLKTSLEDLSPVLQFLDGLHLVYHLIVTKTDEHFAAGDDERLQRFKDGTRMQVNQLCKRGPEQPLLFISARRCREFDWSAFDQDLARAATRTPPSPPA